jgi:hypothetical protein
MNGYVFDPSPLACSPKQQERHSMVNESSGWFTR